MQHLRGRQQQAMGALQAVATPAPQQMHMGGSGGSAAKAVAAAGAIEQAMSAVCAYAYVCPTTLLTGWSAAVLPSWRLGHKPVGHINRSRAVDRLQYRLDGTPLGMPRQLYLGKLEPISCNRHCATLETFRTEEYGLEVATAARMVPPLRCSTLLAVLIALTSRARTSQCNARQPQRAPATATIHDQRCSSSRRARAHSACRSR